MATSDLPFLILDLESGQGQIQVRSVVVEAGWSMTDSHNIIGVERKASIINVPI
jgi:hypothetical protein